MPAPLTTVNIPPVPSAMALDNKGDMISQPWQQWFVNLRNKINVINAAVVGISNLPNPGAPSYLIYNGTSFSYSTVATGITPGTYGDTSHYPIITVQSDGRITNITLQPVSGGSGGILPVVTSEVVSGQPVFVILNDGSLVYVPVT